MFMKLPSFFSKVRRPARQPRVRPTVRPLLEQLEDRLAPATAGVAFSPDQQTVAIQANNQTWTIARPVVSPWNYQATGTTYWVAPGGNDGADGSSGRPFATIAHAVAAAGPGDIVYVGAGTYVENLNITKSGQAGKPIIISCAPGTLGQVTITPSAQYVAANPSGAVITLDQANYVWINGFVIEGPKGRPEAPTSEHYGANGITWENGAGLGDRATNDVVYDNVHCGLKEMDQHIGAGILMEGNVIFNNGTSSLDHGIYMPADNVTMNGNVIFDNAGYGIHSYTAPTGQVITHNVIFGNGQAGIILAGANNQVFYNTCVSNGTGILYFRLGCTGNVVEHNIFAFNGTNCGYDNGGGQLGNPSNNTDDYNCYYPGQPDPRINPGTHEILADPLFLNATAGDFRLAQGSPASAAGAFVGATASSLTSSPASSVSGQSVTFIAKVTDVSGGGTPTGTVSFYDGAAYLGQSALQNGLGIFTTGNLAVGTHSVVVVYGGGGGYGASQSAPATLTVNPPHFNTATTLAASSAAVQVGQPVAFVATVSTGSVGSGIPVGTVTFQAGALVLGTVALDGAGRAVLITTALPVGSDAVVAIYSGGGVFSASASQPVAVQVTPSPYEGPALSFLSLGNTWALADFYYGSHDAYAYTAYIYSYYALVYAQAASSTHSATDWYYAYLYGSVARTYAYYDYAATGNVYAYYALVYESYGDIYAYEAYL